MSVVQLPPVFRESSPHSMKALAAPYHVADPELPRHWEHTAGGHGIVVGIADTGVDHGHPELQGRLRGSRSFVGGNEYDGNGHGTHVATTIAGQSVGVAPNCQIVCAKVLADNGFGDSETTAHGIDWLVSAGCHVINLSLGGPVDDPYTRAAVQRAVKKGVLVFAATGNERARKVGYPAQHCVGVGAVDRTLELAYFSNRGKHVDCVGYGVDVLAGVPGGLYQSMSGTSMATPWIAGVAANRLSAELQHAGEIRTRSTADLLALGAYTKDLGRSGTDRSYGRGFPALDQLFYEGLRAGEPSPATPKAPSGAFSCRMEDVATGAVYHGVLTPHTGEAET